MILLSVTAFNAITAALWAVAGLTILFGFALAWQGRLALSIGVAAAGGLLFTFPVAGLFSGWVKLAFERPDQLLESSIGKAVSAVGLLYAFTGVLPFGILFGCSAVGCLVLFAFSNLIR